MKYKGENLKNEMKERYKDEDQRKEPWWHWFSNDHTHYVSH